MKPNNKNFLLASLSTIGILWSIFTCAAEPFLPERKPWFGLDRAIEIRASDAYQYYRHIHSKSRTVRYHAYNNFSYLSAAVSKDNAMGAEIALTFADTRNRDFGLDNFRITGKYLFLDDVLGAPLSMMGGISFDLTTTKSRNDISSLHQGEYEGEAFISVGKEWTCHQFWTSRWWGMGAIGVANRGSPWMRLLAAWEKNFWDIHQFRIFAHALYGLGQRTLTVKPHFHGYGSIKYRTVDVGLRYSYNVTPFGILSFEYFNSVYAYNAPAFVNTFMLNFLINYGL